MADTNEDGKESIDLLKIRLDYAWRYFDSAARQRMLFINYFLIAVGILASAYGLALKEKLYPVGIYVCIFGFLASIAFMVLDHRMLTFVTRALRVLETLERESLFPDPYKHAKPNGEAGEQLGLARIEPDRAATGKRDSESGHLLTKVKFWIRGVIQGTAAVGFLAGIAFAALLWVKDATDGAVNSQSNAAVKSPDSAKSPPSSKPAPKGSEARPNPGQRQP